MTVGRRLGKFTVAKIVLCLVVPLSVAACTNPSRPELSHERPILRIAVSNAPALATERGVQQFIINQTNEGLLRVNQEGHIESWFAENWERSVDGLRISIHLRKPSAIFHDGSPADAAAIVAILNEQRTKSLKQWAADLDSISAKGDSEIVVTFKRPSSFFIDALMDVPVAKPGTPTIGIGAFKPAPQGTNGGAQIVAHDSYYLGAPTLGGLTVRTYASPRAAWAEMLRDQVDLLYEVGGDAIALMQGATNVSLYSFDRPYQYVLFLNPRSKKLKSTLIRQGLNQAIDRPSLVREALSSHGTPSVGPISEHHWAFQKTVNSVFTYAPVDAVAKLPKGLELSCVTLAGQPYEQLALVLKQQLRNVGVQLAVQEAPLEQIISKLSGDDVDAVLLDALSGWGLSRIYQRWHSMGSANAAKYENSAVDDDLDAINHALTEDQYRAAVSAFQKQIASDPPAVFLAWSERSRAVSTRFDVKPEPGRDVLATLRTWHPRADNVSTTH